MMQSVEKSRAPISIIRALTLKCPLNIYKQLQKKNGRKRFFIFFNVLLETLPGRKLKSLN